MVTSEDQVGNNVTNMKKMRHCTLNICGLSTRSKFMINKFIESEKIDILALQETCTSDLSKLKIENMSVIIDTNKAANKGTALYVSNK